MGDTIEDMDLETEQKAAKIEFLEIKIGLPDSKVFGEMNKLELNQISSRRKGDRIMDRLSNSLIDHIHLKIKSNKTKILNKSFALVLAYL